MVEKMKFLHITGQKDDIDRVMKQYLSHYEIHFENALNSLGSLENIRPFAEMNIYKEIYQKAKILKAYLPETKAGCEIEYSVQEADNIIRQMDTIIKEKVDKQEKLEEMNQKINNWMEKIRPFIGLDIKFDKLKSFQFIDYRFGRIPLEKYHRLHHYIHQNSYSLFYECSSNKEYVWGIYFSPRVYMLEQEALYASFHFEEILIPDDFTGTPREVFAQGARQIETNETERNQLQKEQKKILTEKDKEIISAYECLKIYCENFEIRKYSACTIDKESGEEFYILYGWMASHDAKKLEKEIEQDERISLAEEEVDERISTEPPTKLKNPKMLKPFEMFVEMYGLPAYNEMDPTLFLAFTYTFMFGIMFGDVGQGMVLLVGGFLLYWIKGIRLAGAIAIAGVWSVFFGFMYGSVFGFEHLIPTIWMKPMDHITNILIMAIVFGVLLILIAMLLNIINAIRAKEYGRLLFHQSGLAGLICYGTVTACIILILIGHELPAVTILGTAVGISLISILLKEPLGHLLEKKRSILPEGNKIMFLVEVLVEGFDVILSYATNTISFVRVGAFALSHAGMMGVVMTLSGIEKGNPNWLVIIVGNIVVTGLEGLVVGIQVLRLEYYEMFSRFYKGNGKPFISFKNR